MVALELISGRSYKFYIRTPIQKHHKFRKAHIKNVATLSRIVFVLEKLLYNTLEIALCIHLVTDILLTMALI